MFSVGTFNGGGNVSAAYLKFDSVSSTLAGNYVLGAKLWMYETWSYSCDARPVYVYPVTQAWSVGGNKTYPGPSYGGELGNASFAAGYSSSCDVNGKWQGIDLGNAGRDLVHGWTHGAANHGLTVRASTSDSYGWKKFASYNSANRPYLDVTYTPYWAEYQIGAMNPVVGAGADGTMQVTVTNRGRDTWTPTNNYQLHYRLWDSAGNEISSDKVAWTPVPHDVAPGQSATIAAKVKALPPGSYTLRWDMDHYGTSKFSWTGAPMSGAVTFTIPNLAPVIDSMSPLSNHSSPTLTPVLRMTGHDQDNWPGNGLAYLFKICDAAGDGQQNCTESGWIGAQHWTVPAGKLKWGQSYVWYGAIGDWNTNCPWSGGSYLRTAVPQPSITSQLASGSGVNGKGFDPGVGNYTTSATDAVTGAVGPDLSIVRTYNSLDPRRGLLFGSGWSSRFDTAITSDGDGTGNVVVTYPDGQQARFGKNPDGSYSAPAGRPATLVANSGGGWTLRTKGPTTYVFDTNGRLSKITDNFGREQRLTRDGAGKLTSATDVVSDRSLSFVWAGNHVSKVTTSSSVTLEWNYTYVGDKLTSVCDPTGACTTYDYTAGVHYRSTVLDANPSGYWRLGGPGLTVAVNVAPVTGPTANGQYVGVELGAPGAMPGSGIGSGRFNGTSSHLVLPNDMIRGNTFAAVEMWFKTSSTAGGVLLATGHNKPGDAAPLGGAMPVLYVGTDGKLYGHFWNDQVAGIATGQPVNDGNWHHVLLSGAQNTQTLYLDGTAVGTQNGQIHNLDPITIVGAGRVATGSWPARPANDWGYFQGDITEVAYYDHPVGNTTVSEHWAARTAIDTLTKITRPGGVVAATVAYNQGPDRVREVLDDNGGSWSVGTVDLASTTKNTVPVTNPVGKTTTYTYDPSRGGRLASITNAANASRAFAYDTGGFVNEIVDENGNAFSKINDARGNTLSSKHCKLADTCASSYSSYFHNATDPLDPRNNKVTEYRDGRSPDATSTVYLTAYTYNVTGDLATVTKPGATDTERRTTTHTYTAGTEAAIDGGVMPPGLLLSTTTPGGAVTRYAYSARGNLREITDPIGKVTKFLRDGLGRTISETEVTTALPAGAKTTYTYDGVSRILSQTAPATTNAVTGVAHQQRTINTYNGDGTIASTRIEDTKGNDPARSTSFTYDTRGRIASTTDSTGGITRTEYDALGQKTRGIDAAGTEFTYSYTDARHQLATTTVKGFAGDGTAPHDVVLESRAYDPAGRLATRTDAMGRTVAYRYFADNLLAQEALIGYRDPDTGATSERSLHKYSYNSAQLLSIREDWETPPSGEPVTLSSNLSYAYSYDNAGRTTTIATASNPLAQQNRFTYDLDDNVTKNVIRTAQTDVIYKETDYTYDAAGNELSNSLRSGTTSLLTSTVRDERGLAVRTVDPRGTVTGGTPAAFTTTIEYDELARPINLTAPPVAAESNGTAAQTVSPTKKIGYNTFGEVVTDADANGRVTNIDVDAFGRPIKVTLPAYTPPGSTQPMSAERRATYDALGRLTSTIDPLGSTATFGYDQLGNQTRRTDPQLPGHSSPGGWAATYNPVGEQTSLIDPTGHQRFSTYDDLGKKLTDTVIERVPAPARALTTKYRYDHQAYLSSVTSPDGRTTTVDFDMNGRLSRVTDAAGNYIRNRYDILHRVIERSSPLFNKTTFSYDTASNVTKVDNLDSANAVVRSEVFTYDRAGNRVSAKNGVGATTTYAYDAHNRLTSTTQPISSTESITTGYGYDAAGNITRATNGNGHNTTFTVNAWNLPESTIEPATPQTPAAADRTFTASYDAAGRPTSLTKPGGVTHTTSYDPLGSVVKETGSGASVPTTDRVFGRDLLGRMTSASAPGGTNTYTYDDRGNLVAATGPSGNSTFTWTSDGLPAGTTTPAGTTSFTHDNAGRLATATDPLTGATASYSRDANGRVTTAAFGDGKPTRTYAYDALDRVTADTVKAPDGTVTASTTYQYDAANRLTNKTTAGLAGASANTYGYDQANRLTSWNNGSTSTEYGWNKAGNRTRDGTNTATYNERNQLLTHADAAYTYTPRGTISARTSGSATTAYAFNAFDEMTSAGGANHAYDALNRLINTAGTALTYSGTSIGVTTAGSGAYTYLPVERR